MFGFEKYMTGTHELIDVAREEPLFDKINFETEIYKSRFADAVPAEYFALMWTMAGFEVHINRCHVEVLQLRLEENNWYGRFVVRLLVRPDQLEKFRAEFARKIVVYEPLCKKMLLESIKERDKVFAAIRKT